jgi:site-specific DNA recombinase
MTKKAITYCRVSTAEQSETGYGLQVQQAECKAYALSLGYEVIGEFAEDVSGATRVDERPQGRIVCRMVTAGETQAVIIHRPDRLSRDMGNALTTVGIWIAYGVELHLAQTRELVKSASDIAMVIKFWQADEYRKELRVKSMGGRAAKVADGKLPGNGQAVYGYRATGQKKDIAFEIVESEAEVIRRIFELYTLDGLGVQAIADRLSAEGIPSCADGREWKAKKESVKALGEDWTPKKRRSGQWSPGMVYPILKRECYTGVWHANRYQMTKSKPTSEKATKRKRTDRAEWTAIPIPAIITQAMFDKAQRRLADGRTSAHGGDLPPKHEFLLAGRLTCSCGKHLQGKPSWADGKAYLYYQCNGKSRALTEGTCKLPGLRASRWDKVAWDWIYSLLLHPEELTRGLQREQAERERANQPIRDLLARTEAQLAALDERESRYLELYGDGKYDRSKLDAAQVLIDEQRKRHVATRDELRADLVEVILTDEQIQTIEEFAAEMREGGEYVTFADKKDMVNWLEFKGRVAVEDGETVIYAKCLIGRKRLSYAAVSG